MTTSQYPVLKAFLLSVFLHLGCVILFIFTFYARPVSQKPLIVFLGSILPRHDLSQLNAESLIYQSEKLPLASMGTQWIEGTGRIKTPAQTEKPLLAPALATKPKKTLKYKTQQEPVLRNTAISGEKKDPLVDSTTPPRFPLRLEAK